MLDDVELFAAVTVHAVLLGITTHIRLDQARHGVLQQRQHRVVVHDHLGGLRQQRLALGRVQALIALGNKLFGLAVAVFLGVLVGVTLHQRQERRGVVVVGNPAIACHLVFTVIALLDQDLELHGFEFELDAEFGFPLGGGKNSHLLVVFAGVVGELDFAAGWYTGLCQQFFGSGHALVHRPGGPVVGCHVGAFHALDDHAVGRHLSVGGDFLRQNVAVNHHR